MGWAGVAQGRAPAAVRPGGSAASPPSPSARSPGASDAGAIRPARVRACMY